MTHAEKACEYFQTGSGYNCAQSVFLPFAKKFALSEDDATLLALAFGGGVGGLGETCGALCGAAMTLAYAMGPKDRLDEQAKLKYRCTFQQLAQDFQSQFGSTQCSKLKEQDAKNSLSTESRPCMKYVEFCAKWLETML